MFNVAVSNTNSAALNPAQSQIKTRNREPPSHMWMRLIEPAHLRRSRSFEGFLRFSGTFEAFWQTQYSFKRERFIQAIITLLKTYAPFSPYVYVANVVDLRGLESICGGAHQGYNAPTWVNPPGSFLKHFYDDINRLGPQATMADWFAVFDSLTATRKYNAIDGTLKALQQAGLFLADGTSDESNLYLPTWPDGVRIDPLDLRVGRYGVYVRHGVSADSTLHPSVVARRLFKMSVEQELMSVMQAAAFSSFDPDIVLERFVNRYFVGQSWETIASEEEVTGKTPWNNLRCAFARLSAERLPNCESLFQRFSTLAPMPLDLLHWTYRPQLGPRLSLPLLLLALRDIQPALITPEITAFYERSKILPSALSLVMRAGRLLSRCYGVVNVPHLAVCVQHKFSLQLPLDFLRFVLSQSETFELVSDDWYIDRQDDTTVLHTHAKRILNCCTEPLPLPLLCQIIRRQRIEKCMSISAPEMPEDVLQKIISKLSCVNLGEQGASLAAPLTNPDSLYYDHELTLLQHVRQSGKNEFRFSELRDHLVRKGAKVNTARMVPRYAPFLYQTSLRDRYRVVT